MAEIGATNTDQSKYLASALGWREWILTPRIGPNLVLSGGVGQLPERITTNLPRRRRWRQRFDPAIAILDIESFPQTFPEEHLLIRWSRRKELRGVCGRSFHEQTKCYHELSYGNLPTAASQGRAAA